MLLQPSILFGTFKNSAPIFINPDNDTDNYDCTWIVANIETAEEDRGTSYSGKKKRIFCDIAVLLETCAVKEWAGTKLTSCRMRSPSVYVL
jgi:hypothetical protein